MTLVCFNGMVLRMFDLTIADGFPRSSLLGPSPLFGSERTEHTSVTKFQRVRAANASMRKPASGETSSASMLL